MIKNTITNKVANKNGFSLIELMIALTIFAIGILALAQLQSSAIVYNSEARRYTDATIIAQSTIDDIKAMDYDSINNPSTNTQTVDSYTVTINIDDGPIVGATLEVGVVVSWVHRGVKNYSLNTIIADK